MKIHKLTAQLMSFLIIASLSISYMLIDKTSGYMNWLENIFIGIFASSLLVLITSCVSYIYRRESVNIFFLLEPVRIKK